MRVALVHPYAWPDVRRGGERYLADLAWYLRGAGHRVDVITARTGQPATNLGEQGADVRLRQLPELSAMGMTLRQRDWFGVRALPMLVRERYDVVHALVPAAALAARLARQRVVFTLLGQPTEELLHVPAWTR